MAPGKEMSKANRKHIKTGGRAHVSNLTLHLKKPKKELTEPSTKEGRKE